MMVRGVRVAKLIWESPSVDSMKALKLSLPMVFSISRVERFSDSILITLLFGPGPSFTNQTQMVFFLCSIDEIITSSVIIKFTFMSAQSIGEEEKTLYSNSEMD